VEEKKVYKDLFCKAANGDYVAVLDVNAFYDDRVLEFVIDDRHKSFDVWKASVAIGIDVDDVLTESRTSHNLILCEGNDIDIQCPYDETIAITHANYGRTDGTTCPHALIKTTDCTDAGHTAMLQAECDGKNKCRVWSRNSFWGDTCDGTHKYLDVDYDCVGDSSGHPVPDDFECMGIYEPAPASLHYLNCSLPDDVEPDFCDDLVVAIHLQTVQGKESWCPGEEFPDYPVATYTKVPLCGCDREEDHDMY